MSLPQDPDDLRTLNLLRDAEEDLQRERLQAFWREWGSTIIGMCVMLVVGTAIGVFWREWQISRSERSTSALFAAERYSAPIQIMEKDMLQPHLAMAWLTQAANISPESKDELQEAYQKASNTSASEWSWLGTWNALRVSMDDPQSDPETLLAEYEKLAIKGKAYNFSALAYLDAALIAGERLHDPARALDYVTKAAQAAPLGSATAALTTDLSHLYEIRKQSIQAEAN